MVEFIKRDAVVEMLNKWADGYSYIEVPTKDALACVMEITAADVRPVVLCRDCAHRPIIEYGSIVAPEDADGYIDYACPFVCVDPWYNMMPAEDDYCSRGEKRRKADEAIST